MVMSFQREKLKNKNLQAASINNIQKLKQQKNAIYSKTLFYHPSYTISYLPPDSQFETLNI